MINEKIFYDFDTIASALELLSISVNDNNEKLVYLPDIVCNDIEFRVPKYLCASNDDKNSALKNTCFYGREEIATKLNAINDDLKNINPNASLVVTNVYRLLKVQEENFNKIFNEIKTKFPSLNENEQIEKAHLMIAYPKVAGHTTGGAIDLTIKINDKLLDMGCEIGDFDREDLLFVKSPFITKEQFENRLLLRKLMISHNFAPFNGEWWHFSYGDREWAKIYNKQFAIYDIKNL